MDGPDVLPGHAIIECDGWHTSARSNSSAEPGRRAVRRGDGRAGRMVGVGEDFDFPDNESWLPTEPAPVVPVPAANSPDLRGQRVIVGEPGRGWRGDLRADDPVMHGGRTHVPVLAEHDYYHAELEGVEIFAPLVPIERVWVEHLLASPTQASPGLRPEQFIEDELTSRARRSSRDFFARLVTLDAPPPRLPVPVRDVPNVTGRRVVQVQPSGERRDLRAASEPYENAEGDICVRVCDEPDWYAWSLTGRIPETRETPIYLLWTE